MKKLTLSILVAITLVIAAACGIAENKSMKNGDSDNTHNMNASRNYAHVSVETTVTEVVGHPAFAGFGQYVLPVKTRSSISDSIQISNIDSLLPYHGYINEDTTVEVINYLIDQAESGETVFYDIYDEQQKQDNIDKESTGLFFFRGETGAPFAIICAGGGFTYVGSIHESFPLALELSKKGYNAFAIEYRVGGANAACEDLAAAISFVFENADKLGVSTESYSLWGGSAGARMAVYLGSYGTVYFGGSDLPKPAAVIMQYTGHSNYTENDPPTYACIGENDGIASWRTMEQRISNLAKLGIDTEFHKYPNLGHGFGLGIGTVAEGWFEDAVMFWENHIEK